MEKKDKTIKCKDCGQDFIFTVRDQEFYEEKGFKNEPERCKPCRDKKKANRSNFSGGNRNFNNNRSNFSNRDAA